jgi:hypothetical protein
MMFISHRGNLNGPRPEDENKPWYIEKAIDAGFMVEVDIRCYGPNQLWFGHDEHQYEVPEGFLDKHRNSLILHCKDWGSLDEMLHKSYHYFWHQEDKYTLTSWGYVWGYPGVEAMWNVKYIACEPDMSDLPRWLSDVGGICSDYVGVLWKKKL